MATAKTTLKRPDKSISEALLKLRRKSKAKKPVFVRQESWRYTRVKNHWRKPKGVDSKMRIGRKGWPDSPNVGYKTPKAVRGLHPSGFYEAPVCSTAGLEGLDPKRVALRIASNVGARKRIVLLEEARKRGFLVLNPGRARELPEKGAEAETEAKAEAESEEEEDA